eukprot:CAMPEP_0172449440 /NCGR_PEP_ID=MMETSP1065-20121228/8157_1 /TAXON_ID=265537 /ORGANISM="Amphiprora paludosa, Strain CCMP125" /LENGTH=64 /DNA_ID=CAMNT_0013201117 /DNA_START=87 /DNA_END=277 /DNA_ORIENTATION=+
MTGVSPSFVPAASSHEDPEVEDDKLGAGDNAAVSRAYFKLQEALQRYQQDHNMTTTTTTTWNWT